MRPANENTIAWGGWAVIAVAFAIAGVLLIWSAVGWVSHSHLFRPIAPDEVRLRALPDGAMSPDMAGAIYRKIGSEEDAQAMTAATRGPVHADDMGRLIASRRRFVDMAARYGFAAGRADDGFWMITSAYRPEGDGQKLRERMDRIDPP